MKYFILVFSILGVCMGTVGAQAPSETMKEYARTIQAADLKAHLEFLADDLMEGRETGTRGIELAALYLKTQFQRMGLAPGVPANNSYYQYYVLQNKRIKNLEMTVGKSVFSYPEDFMSFSVGDVPATLKGEFAFAGYAYSFNPDQLSVKNYAGKIAIAIADTWDGEESGFREKRAERRNLTKFLKEQGAKGLFIIQTADVYDRYKDMAGIRSISTSDGSETPFPIFYTSPAVGAALLKSAKTSVSKVRKAVRTTDSFPKIDLHKVKWSYQADLEASSVRPSNVLGYLEGTDKKDEVIVFTAHYDHEGVNQRGDIYNGADDDGSGTSTIVELAEAFMLAARDGYRPRRSLLFMAVSGEEKGLLGSGFYTEHPVYPLEQTVANLNIDMIGRTDRYYEGNADSARYVYVIGSDRLSSELHEINEEMNKGFAKIKLDYKYNDPSDPNRFYERSDHYNFAKKGVPIIFYFTGVHRDYHKPTDTVDKINFNKITRIARLIFATGWELANRDERIVVDKKTGEEP